MALVVGDVFDDRNDVSASDVLNLQTAPGRQRMAVERKLGLLCVGRARRPPGVQFKESRGVFFGTVVSNVDGGSPGRLLRFLLLRRDINAALDIDPRRSGSRSRLSQSRDRLIKRQLSQPRITLHTDRDVEALVVERKHFAADA